MAGKTQKKSTTNPRSDTTSTNSVPVAGPPWNYHERVDKAVGVVSSWYVKQTAVVRAKLDRHLDQLRPLAKTEWGRPRASPLANHIYVIRFSDQDRKQLRVFGHFHDAHAAFVMTFDGYEKDNVYYPRDYKTLASEHKACCDAAFVPSTQPFRDRCEICREPVSVKH